MLRRKVSAFYHLSKQNKQFPFRTLFRGKDIFTKQIEKTEKKISIVNRTGSGKQIIEKRMAQHGTYKGIFRTKNSVW